MERLKGSDQARRTAAIFKFTFQYGEIKRPTKSDALYTQMVFTFQYGEIKSGKLKDSAIEKMIFTFQYGEIKSGRQFRHGNCMNFIYIPVWRD